MGFATISEIRRVGDNLAWWGLKFAVRDIETYGGETQEWGAAQLHYGILRGI